MSISERRKMLVNRIEASTADFTVNHRPYRVWLRDNLDIVIQQDVFIELDEVAITHSWHDAVTLAIRWAVGGGDDDDGYGVGSAWQEALVGMRNQAAREWLNLRRENVRRVVDESAVNVNAIVDALTDEL